MRRKLEELKFEIVLRGKEIHFSAPDCNVQELMYSPSFY